MSGYIGNIPVPQATQTRDTFTATAGQTSFATSGYTPGYLDVFLNGVHLVNGTDYTASNGSDVVLTSGAASGDNLEVVAYTTFQVVDQSFSGNFSVDSPTFVVDAANNRVGVGTASPSHKISVLSAGGSGNYNLHSTASSIVNPNSTGSEIVGAQVSIGNNIVLSERQVNGAFSDRTDLAFVTDTGFGLGKSEKMRLDAAGHLIVPAGVTLGTATGVYSAANTLDDYEEGTWTPAFSSGSGITYVDQEAYYTKTGNIVNFHFQLSWSAGTSLSTVVTGLPFAVRNIGSHMYPMCSVWNNVGITYPAGRTTLIAYPVLGASNVQLDCVGSAIGAGAPTLGTSGGIYVTGFYYTDA